MISVDGYFEGPNHELDWHNVDDEFNDLAISFLDTVDTLLFGRATYELMAGYWPTEHATTDDPIVAAKMNSLRKSWFRGRSRVLPGTTAQLVKGNVVDEVRKLKQPPGKNVAIFGSSDLAAALMQQQLIDEYRIMVNPVILGAGKSLFDGLGRRQKLKLVESKVFRSGNVLLCYQPERSK